MRKYIEKNIGIISRSKKTTGANNRSNVNNRDFKSSTIFPCKCKD